MDRKTYEENNRGLFIKKAKQKARPIVERRRAKLAEEGKTLSKAEENKIIEKIAKKMKKQFAVRGFFVALGLSAGIGIGATGTKMLDSAKNKGITQTENTIDIDAAEAEKNINIENNNKYNQREVFVNGVRVDQDRVKRKVYQQIEDLDTKEKILEYVKNMFVKKYNENNKTQLKAEDINIYKELYGIEVFNDKAENGDNILRQRNNGGQKYENGVYTINIQKGEDLEKQIITRNDDGTSTRIYYQDDKVEKYEENEATELGNIIITGIDYAISKNQENYVGVDDIYKDRFVNAISQYREQKIEKIIKDEDKTNVNNQSEREME